jgi:hypothetical protein
MSATRTDGEFFESDSAIDQIDAVSAPAVASRSKRSPSTTR